MRVRLFTRVCAVLVMFAIGASMALVQAQSMQPPLLLRHPSISQTQIVFNYGGSLWVVSRDGGTARRLTAGPGRRLCPPSRQMARWWRSRVSTMAIRTCSSCRRRAGFRDGLHIIRARTMSLGGLQTGRTFFSCRTARAAITSTTNCFRCRRTVAIQVNIRCRSSKPRRFRRTDRIWHMFHMASGSPRGSVTGGDRRRRSGSRT